MAYICTKYKDSNSCKECPHFRFDEENDRMACWAAEDQKKSLKKIIDFVKDAIERYGDDHVCVSIIDDDGRHEYSVDYHDSKNGFPIHETGVSPDVLGTDELSDALDELGVSRDF